MDNLLNEWKKHNKEAQWNELQKFCSDNSEENIIAIAQTGMGKTEGGLRWIGDNKGFVVLPIRTAINAVDIPLVIVPSTIQRTWLCTAGYHC